MPEISTTHLDWNDIRFFLAVARAGGLTPAAQLLGVSPATVSRRIDALEQATGMGLFLRRQTGYVLTDDGERLLASAQPVEQAMDGVLRQTQQPGSAGAWTGTVRVATSETLATTWIAPKLGQFFNEHPGLQVEILTGVNMLNLSRRDADIALRMAPPSKDEEGDYIAVRAGAMPFAVYAAHSLQTNTQADAGWRSLPYVNWSESLAHMTTAKWTAAAFGRKAPRLLTNSMPVMAAAAHEGAAVALLPMSVGDADSRLHRVEPGHCACTIDLWVMHHRDLRDNRRVMAMKAFLLDVAKLLSATSVPPSSGRPLGPS